MKFQITTLSDSHFKLDGFTYPKIYQLKEVNNLVSLINVNDKSDQLMTNVAVSDITVDGTSYNNKNDLSTALSGITFNRAGTAALPTDAEFETSKTGDIPTGDYTEVRADGTVRLKGEATAWKDMVTDISGRRLNSTVGKVDYDYDNNAIKFQSGGSMSNSADRVSGNQEINHEFKVGADIVFKPHIHWFQEVVSHTPDVLDATPYVITLRWRIVRNGRGVNLTTPAWTTITSEMGSGGDDVFDVTLADGKEYIGQISKFDDIVVDCGVSDTIQFQMARTDTETGDILVFFMDTHGMIDSFGSDDEIAKAE